MDYRAIFERGLSYNDFLLRFASPSDQARWHSSFERVVIPDDQRATLAAFRRRMPVLCMAGAWCGDCVRQCPIMERIASASSAVELRFVDRDVERELAAELTICGAPRVPQAVFLSEDFEFVSRTADRTLTQYRHLASRLSGASCDTGIVAPGDPQQGAVIADWIAEFERAQLILRTSPKLRERHAD